MRAGLLPIALVVAALPLGACGGQASSPLAPTASGMVNVMLKDTPYGDAAALLVTFSDVSFLGDSGWTPVAFSGGGNARTCDLKRLADIQDILATGDVAAGRYSAVRFTVTGAELFFDEGTSGRPCAASLPRPGGASATVAVPVHQATLDVPFEVTAGQVRAVVVDFDAEQSIVLSGGAYVLIPAVTVVGVQ